MKLLGADIICECLLEQNINKVFGYPGGAALNTYDALYKYRSKITHIMTAHEQGASHAADGYARSTGKTGVVFATSGPGATNLVTGIATANIDSIPMVAITGNVATGLLGRDSFQEVDIVDIVKPITKASFLVEDVKDLAPTIRKAFKTAESGRKGPVLIDVPKDITEQKCEYKKEKLGKIKKPVKSTSIEGCLELISNSEKPLIYAGGGIIRAEAWKEFQEFVELIDAPVASSLMGMGSIPASHKLFLGKIGMHGNYTTGKATENADLIIACGARFSDRVAGDRENFGSNAKIIHLDIDENEINKNVEVDCFFVGDLKDSLKLLNENLKQKDNSSWLKKVNLWKNSQKLVFDENSNNLPNPYEIIDIVNNIKNKKDIIATDVGQHQMWVAQYAKIESPKTLLTSGGMGTMGFGMGAAIGAQVANPKQRTILFTGDGSFHMNLNELVTLRKYNIPVMVIIMNNSVLGMVRQWQKLFYDNRFSETDPKRETDFVKVAEGFKVKGFRINKGKDAKEILTEAYNLNEPVVVDCTISPDDNVLPMIPPGKTVEEIITEM